MTEPRVSTLPAITWLTVQEVAEYFGLARMTVYRMIKRGDLPAIQIGSVGRNFRIDEEVVKDLIGAARVPRPESGGL